MTLKDSDRYLTPLWIFAAEAEYWSGSIDLDPFYDPEGPPVARNRWDIRQGMDAYKVEKHPHLSVHVNGPYSGDHPSRTARLLYDWHRRSPNMESVNVCPAAVGSTYWRRHVWAMRRARRRGGLVIGWAGRLGFEAAVDIRDKHGEVRCEKGETQNGNRTEIAIVANVDRQEFFAHLLRSHSPKPMEVTIL